ncbi:unnamed protein product [Amoebophrya sp. A25]|nr:unnamed protein product [Amoebophrya sp. A25]|eukprot:GSA25T00026473001.1
MPSIIHVVRGCQQERKQGIQFPFPLTPEDVLGVSEKLNLKIGQRREVDEAYELVAETYPGSASGNSNNCATCWIILGVNGEKTRVSWLVCSTGAQSGFLLTRILVHIVNQKLFMNFLQGQRESAIHREAPHFPFHDDAYDFCSSSNAATGKGTSPATSAFLAGATVSLPNGGTVSLPNGSGTIKTSSSVGHANGGSSSTTTTAKESNKWHSGSQIDNITNKYHMSGHRGEGPTTTTTVVVHPQPNTNTNTNITNITRPPPPGTTTGREALANKGSSYNNLMSAVVVERDDTGTTTSTKKQHYTKNKEPIYHSSAPTNATAITTNANTSATNNKNLNIVEEKRGTNYAAAGEQKIASSTSKSGQPWYMENKYNRNKDNKGDYSAFTASKETSSRDNKDAPPPPTAGDGGIVVSSKKRDEQREPWRKNKNCEAVWGNANGGGGGKKNGDQTQHSGGTGRSTTRKDINDIDGRTTSSSAKLIVPTSFYATGPGSSSGKDSQDYGTTESTSELRDDHRHQTSRRGQKDDHRQTHQTSTSARRAEGSKSRAPAPPRLPSREQLETKKRRPQENNGGPNVEVQVSSIMPKKKDQRPVRGGIGNPCLSVDSASEETGLDEPARKKTRTARTEHEHVVKTNKVKTALPPVPTTTQTKSNIVDVAAAELPEAQHINPHLQKQEQEQQQQQPVCSQPPLNLDEVLEVPLEVLEPEPGVSARAGNNPFESSTGNNPFDAMAPPTFNDFAEDYVEEDHFGDGGDEDLGSNASFFETQDEDLLDGNGEVGEKAHANDDRDGEKDCTDAGLGGGEKKKKGRGKRGRGHGVKKNTGKGGKSGIKGNQGGKGNGKGGHKTTGASKKGKKGSSGKGNAGKA